MQCKQKMFDNARFVEVGKFVQKNQTHFTVNVIASSGGRGLLK